MNRKFRIEARFFCIAFLEDNQEKRKVVTGEGFDSQDAGRRYQKKHPHVILVDSTVLSGDPSFKLLLGVKKQDAGVRTSARVDPFILHPS